MFPGRTAYLDALHDAVAEQPVQPLGDQRAPLRDVSMEPPYFSGRVLATRKPVLKSRRPGAAHARASERCHRIGCLQWAPRVTFRPQSPAQQLSVHSRRLPTMSKMPAALGSKEPTAQVPPIPKHPLGLPAAPRSHSTSVGKRYWWPVLTESHSAYTCASFQLTHATGCRPVCKYPGFRQLRGRSPQRGSAAFGTASAKARYSSSVTSYRPMAKSPSGRGTISGQTSQSRNTSPAAGGRGSRGGCSPVPGCPCAHCIRRTAKAGMKAQAMVRRACPFNSTACNIAYPRPRLAAFVAKMAVLANTVASGCTTVLRMP